MFLVPTDTPGYRTERIEDKLGIRTNQNAEVVLEDCRVPLGNLVGEVNRGVALRSRVDAGGSAKEGVKALGVARAASEDALAWAWERVQGGKRLIEHGSTAATIGEMGMRIEMCRSLCWRTAWSVDESLPQARLYEAMAMRSAKEVGTEGHDRGGRVARGVRDAARAGRGEVRPRFDLVAAHRRGRSRAEGVDRVAAGRRGVVRRSATGPLSNRRRSGPPVRCRAGHELLLEPHWTSGSRSPIVGWWASRPV